MAVVQSKIGTKSVNSADHSVTFDSAPTENNLLVGFIHHRNSADRNDIDWSAGWTEINGGVASAVGEGAYKIAGASESSTVTVTTTAIAAAGVMIIAELDDIDTTTPLDVSVVDTNGSDVTSLTVGDITTNNATSQMLCFIGVRAGGDDASFSFTNSFTMVQDGESSGTSPSGGGLAYRRVTSTGTYNTEGSWTDAGRCVGILCAFKETAAAAGTQQIISNLHRNQYKHILVR